MKDIKILVVDDDKVLCRALRDLLVAEGYNVSTANNGADAVALVNTGEFRLVMTDLVLPDTSGIELLKKIKQLDGTMQVIIMTAHSTMQLVLECLENGAGDYLLKPFGDPQEVLDSVGETVRKLKKWESVLRGRKTT